MKLRTAMGWLGVAFLIAWVCKIPGAAAYAVRSAGMFLTAAAAGISAWFAQL